MNPVWIGFLIGVFVGCSIGTIVIGLLLGGSIDTAFVQPDLVDSGPVRGSAVDGQQAQIIISTMN